MAQRKPSRRKRTTPRNVKNQSVPAKPGTASSHDNLNTLHQEWKQFRNYKLPLILLVLVTLAAYANAWPNNLVADDPTFAVSNRYSNLDLTSVARFFTNDVWGITGFDSGLYRPLLLLSIMVDSLLFGEWVAGYHLTNIFLHLLTTLLVFGLVRHLLIAAGGKSPFSDQLAVLAAMIFGVHPIHTEAINSIFNRSEILVSLGITGGLWWFLRTWKLRPKTAWFGLGVIYLMVLFCKESGATLPALAVILLCSTLSEPWLLRLKKCLPIFLLVIPFGIYLVLRAHALDTGSTVQQPDIPGTEQASELTVLPQDESTASDSVDILTEVKPQPAGELPGPFTVLTRQFSKLPGVLAEFKDYDPGRLPHAVRLWADSLRLVLWPHPLRLYHGDPTTPFWVALTLQALLLGMIAWGSWNGRPGLISGLFLFYIAMLPSSGIVGMLGYPQVAERFLYLPTVGLTITLAFGLRMLAQKFSLRGVTVSIALLTLLLTPIGWARNAEWATDIKLNEAEYRKGATTERTLGNLVLHNMREKNISESIRICELHADQVATSPDFSYYCGLAYEGVGRFAEAGQAYVFATNSRIKAPLAYLALALMQVKLDEKLQARENFEQAIALMKKPFLKDFHTALMLVKLYPLDRSELLRARALLEQTLEQQPEYFPARLMLQQLNEILANGGSFERQDRQ